MKKERKGRTRNSSQGKNNAAVAYGNKKSVAYEKTKRMAYEKEKEGTQKKRVVLRKTGSTVFFRTHRLSFLFFKVHGWYAKKGKIKDVLVRYRSLLL